MLYNFRYWDLFLPSLVSLRTVVSSQDSATIHLNTYAHKDPIIILHDKIKNNNTQFFSYMALYNKNIEKIIRN